MINGSRYILFVALVSSLFGCSSMTPSVQPRIIRGNDGPSHARVQTAVTPCSDDRVECVVTDDLGDVDVERGECFPLLDGIGWVVGIPSKVVLWDARADNHDIGAATERQVVDYMKINDIRGTKVRLNQYDPVGEWRRLGSNHRVGAGWRYTVGALHTLGYSFFPGRVFGRDSYNPYTDSVHVYSDIPALALEQAAYAKDVHSRRHPGTYSAVQELPFIQLWHEHRSKQDVLDYYASRKSRDEQREARNILHPQFGSEVGEQFDEALVVGQGVPLFRLTGAAIGHISARIEKR